MNKNEKHQTDMIPGFYYDEDKKKYFKICQSGFSYKQSILTKERIQSIQAEKKRINDIKSYSGASSKHVISSAMTLFKKREYGFVKTPINFVHNIYRSIYSKLDCSGHLMMFEEDNPCLSTKISVDKSDKTLVVIDEYLGNFYAFNINSNNKQLWMCMSVDSLGSLMFGMEAVCHSSLNCKIVDFDSIDDEVTVVFGNANEFSPSSKIFLVSKKTGAIKYFKNFKSQIYAGAVDITGHVLASSDEFGLKMFSIANDSYLMVNRKSFAQPILNSMDFSKNDNCIFVGDRRSCISFFNYKTDQNLHFFGNYKGNVHITNLYSSADGCYLLSASSMGQIYLWDVRMRKIILQYKGHTNSYKKLAIVVNSTEEFISSVGLDGYARIWDYKTSELLKTIPPPVPSEGVLPAICFMPQLLTTSPGLIMLLKKEFYAYTFS